MNLMVQPNRLCLIVKLYINSPELLPDTHDMRTFLIHCHAINGHQLEYLHHLYMGALQHKGDNYVFVVPKRFEKEKGLLEWPEARNIRIEFISEIELQQSRGLLRSSFIYSRNLARSIRRFKATHVILISLIVYLPFLPLFVNNRIKVRGIIYRIYLYEWKEEGAFKRFLDALKYTIITRFKLFERAYVLNDVVSTRYLNRKYRTNKFYYLPDPVAIISGTVGHNIRSKLGIGLDKIILLHPGSMNPYKGTLNILRALDIMPSEVLNRFALVTAGQTRSIRNQFDELLSRLRDRVALIHIEGFISFEELADLFETADYVIIPYAIKSQSSGIVGHAAYFEKPVIVGRDGLIGRIVRQNHLGYGLSDITPEAIKDFLMSIPRWTHVNNNYVKEHSIDRFISKIID